MVAAVIGPLVGLAHLLTQIAFAPILYTLLFCLVDVANLRLLAAPARKG